MQKSATTQRRCGRRLMPGPFALLATIGAGLSVAVLPAARSRPQLRAKFRPNRPN